MLVPHLSWAEKVIRPMLVYIMLLVVFHLASKRQLAQATLFDFLILLLISNVVQNAIIGQDDSVGGATAGTLALVLLSYLFNAVTSRSHPLRAVLEGMPILLISEGEIRDDAMREKNVARNDLLSAIRKQGLSRLADVNFAILELDGTISIIKAEDDKRPHDCLPEEIVGGESADAKEH